MRKSLLTVAAAAGLVATVALAGPVAAHDDDHGHDKDRGRQRGRHHQTIRLSGAQEVPVNVHGNDDRGTVTVKLDDDAGRICVRFGPLRLTAGEPLPNAAHIHRGVAGVAGPVVVPLFAAATAPTSYPTGRICVAVADPLLHEIDDNPAGFYVNLHNATHPSGVVRGQLKGT